MSKLPRVTGQQTIRALQRLWFRLSHVRGSHHYLFHPQKRLMVAVPVHAGRVLPPKTLLSILKHAKVNRDEFAKALKE
ncbi:MAG: hypothetical protein HZLCBSQH_002244 [Candidatus Fervidibacterota bacterium]